MSTTTRYQLRVSFVDAPDVTYEIMASNDREDLLRSALDRALTNRPVVLEGCTVIPPYRVAAYHVVDVEETRG